MRNKLEWVDYVDGAYCILNVDGCRYQFVVAPGLAYCRRNSERKRVANVISYKGAAHLKDKIIEKTIKTLQADVDKLRTIAGMEEEEK